MNLSQKIAAEVDALAATGCFPATCGAQVDLHTIALHLAAAAPFGVVIDDFRFNTTHAFSSMRTLEEWGGRLARTINYLMEPLHILEVDSLLGEVEMRSLAATIRAGTKSFYEIRLTLEGGLSLKRFSYDESTRTKRAVPCQFTREVLERLVDDLVATAPAPPC